MKFFSDSYHLFVYHMRLTLRMPIFVIISIVQPIIWLVFFGELFRAVTSLPGFERSYQEFLAPGLALMSALMGASYTGMGILTDIQNGTLDRLLATPVGRGAMIAARVVQAAVTVMIQCLVILGFAWLMGVRPPGPVTGVFGVLVAAAMLGAAVSALSNALALVIKQPQVLVAIVNFTLLPAVFLSSLMMQHDLMPNWIRAGATVNPLDWAVTVSRNSFNGDPWGQTQIGLLLAVVVVAWWLAIRAFGRYRATL